MNSLKSKADEYYNKLKKDNLNFKTIKDDLNKYIVKQKTNIDKDLKEIDIKLRDKINEIIRISFTDIFKIRINKEEIFNAQDSQFEKNIKQIIREINLKYPN